MDRIPHPSRSAVEGVLADTLVGQGSIVLAAHQEVLVAVFEPAGVIFGCLAKRVVTA